MTRLIALAAGASVALAAAAAHAQPSPQDYVAKAGASDLFEITEARVAEQRSHNPRVLEFARTMVADHGKSTAKIKAAATRSMGHAPPPARLEDHQRGDLRDLRSANAHDFDRVYMTQQAAAHKDALDLHRNYAENGSNPALKRAAGEIRPVVEHHLAMANGLADHLN